MIRLRHFIIDETGTATIEFLFVFPIVMTLFMASLESSLFTLRHVMLERNVDIVVRSIRLGLMDGTTHSQLKEAICNRGGLVGTKQNCIDSLKIWMQPVDTANFNINPPRSCVDKSQPISTTEPPAGEFSYGIDNQIMLIRLCLKGKPWFPTSAIGAQMIKDEGDGNYALVTTSVFVNEPG
jgi:hypothetical protein